MALLKTKESMSTEDSEGTIYPVCLAKHDFDLSRYEGNGEDCLVAGWGVTG